MADQDPPSLPAQSPQSNLAPRDKAPPAGKFKNFTLLPAEIRIMIWRHALLLPRVITFDCRYDIPRHYFHHNRNSTRRHAYLPPSIGSFRRFGEPNDIPPLLHVCKEARYEALAFGGFSREIPLRWIAFRGFVARWLPFRPDVDVAFIASYDKFGSASDQRTDYSQQSRHRYTIFGRRLKKVVLSKAVAQRLMKYVRVRVEEDAEHCVQSVGVSGVGDLAKAFPGLRELAGSVDDTLVVFDMCWDRLNESVGDLKARRNAAADGSAAQSKMVVWIEGQICKITFAPSAWEYLELYS